MRVWQKIYFVTLEVFLVVLNLGLFLAAGFIFRHNLEIGRQQAKNDCYFLSQNLEHDFSILERNGRYEEAIIGEVVSGYQNFYRSGKVEIRLSGGKAASGSETVVESEVTGGGNLIFVRVEQNLAAPYADYRLFYEKELTDLEELWKNMKRMFVFISLGTSGVLCLILYVVMKKILKPLEKLNLGVAKIADGDYGWRIDWHGCDEIAELSENVNRMSATIQAQMQTLREESEKKQQLMDNMAHELRTPLTSIYGYAEYLNRAKTTEEEKYEGLSYIMSESSRLAKMGETMLSMRMYERSNAEFKAVSVEKMSEHVERMLSGKLQDNGILLEKNLNVAYAWGDEGMLINLFRNLLENALRAELGKSTDGGDAKRIIWRGFVRDGKAVFEITDNGIGMDEEELACITEPFYRVDKARSRAGGGAGLGLSIVQRIVERHDGTLAFESKKGAGTRVTVVLSLADCENVYGEDVLQPSNNLIKNA